MFRSIPIVNSCWFSGESKIVGLVSFSCQSSPLKVLIRNLGCIWLCVNRLLCYFFSHVVGPCHPFRRDPDLDYNVDSDEEWEEVLSFLFKEQLELKLWFTDGIVVLQEDPGESLSNYDKDDGEEILEEEYSKADEEEESEDGFFVPDGYLLENEVIKWGSGVILEVDLALLGYSCSMQSISLSCWHKMTMTEIISCIPVSGLHPVFLS
jgi:hypothetical protein